MYDFFWDLRYLLRRCSGCHVQILAASYEPVAECEPGTLDGSFTFCGYDLMDRRVEHSLLLNDDRMRDAFSNARRTRFGLLDSLAEATLAKSHLLRDYAALGGVKGCGIWALWSMEDVPESTVGCEPGADPGR